MSEFLEILRAALPALAAILSLFAVFSKDRDTRDGAFRSAVLIFLMLILGEKS